jgi:hypothetical protein
VGEGEGEKTPARALSARHIAVRNGVAVLLRENQRIPTEDSSHRHTIGVSF